MNNQEAILVLKSGSYNPQTFRYEFANRDIIPALMVAEEALNEQAEREKGCEYCSGDALKGVALTTTWGMPKVALHSGEELTESEKFKFCPNCGRDLRKPVSK